MRHTLLKSSLILFIIAIPLLFSIKQSKAQEQCASTANNYGTVTTSIAIPAAGSYMVWSLLSPLDAKNNAYWLVIDNNCPIVVGDNDQSIPQNAWTWINYKDGNTTSPILLPLTQGNHTIQVIGKDPGVKIDQILFLSDATCIPIGLGNNCISSPTPTVQATLAPSATSIPTATTAPTTLPTATKIPPTATPTPTKTPTPIPPTPTTTPATTNLLKNPGFESGNNGNWYTEGAASIVNGKNNAKSGSWSLRIGTGSGYADQKISSTIGRTYRLTTNGKLSNTGATGKIGLLFRNSSGSRLTSSEPTPLSFTTTTYQQKTLSFTVPTGASQVWVYAIKSDTTINFYVDDLSVMQQ